jgi:uncharacterized repeat protein (TIGR03803 family)
MFTPVSGAKSTNSDGAYPNSGLILSGNTLYGTANSGGSGGSGTVFAVNPNGTGFTPLHMFTAVSGAKSTNSDGAYPWGGLLLSGNTLYGTATEGGSAGYGTVFALNTDGTGFTTLYSFTGASGEGTPAAPLILSGNTLYGTSQGVGTTSGTVFAVNTNGTGFTNLHVFTALSGAKSTNSDGAWPDFGPILSGNTLYGMTKAGGRAGYGTVFAVNTDGTGFTNLHTFAGATRDGAYPHAGLMLLGNTLYGTAEVGGSWNQGTVFAVNTDGTGYTNLYSFTGTGGQAWPYGPLTLSGNTLYGSSLGTDTDTGAVFAVNTNGTSFTTLHVFTVVSGATSTNRDGAYPAGGLIFSGTTLYGSANGGGRGGSGSLFRLSFAPQLTIIRSGPNVILTWPTNYPGFDYTGYTLQSTANLGSAAVWTTNAPGPVVVNGQNTVTNPISGSQQFFRLSQ